jgi:YD repeat-containing protein
VPHLMSISGGSASRTFAYANLPLVSPWGQSQGNIYFLSTVTNAASQTHTFYYTPYSELSRIVYPYGGELRWEFRDFTYTGSRTVREVQYRWLRKAIGAVETLNSFGHDDGGDATRSYHAMSFIVGSGLPGDKVWYFNTDRRLSTYQQRAAAAVVKVQKDYLWGYSGANSSGPYISQATTTLEPGTGQKQSPTSRCMSAGELKAFRI